MARKLEQLGPTEAGEKSHLYLHDPKFFHIPQEKETALHGELHNLIKVSLLDCICPGTGTIGMKDNCVHNAKVFPHYIVSGQRHLGPQEEVIAEIEFRVTDAHTLFYDFAAFGHVIHGEKFIDAIANANKIEGDPKVKPDPIRRFSTSRASMKWPTSRRRWAHSRRGTVRVTASRAPGALSSTTLSSRGSSSQRP
jgi:hypothetical protein